MNVTDEIKAWEKEIIQELQRHRITEWNIKDITLTYWNRGARTN